MTSRVVVVGLIYELELLPTLGLISKTVAAVSIDQKDNKAISTFLGMLRLIHAWVPVQ